ncbi:LamG-like jellyroll fold domain-containing protein [Micromonospora purpureochromogenes]|uniref:LamG-like jellyroll fold domain-containing protein n=1 Tax=Micromonospora purpureochromogenes TaxID=47872 RepID=UPI00362D10D4
MAVTVIALPESDRAEAAPACAGVAGSEAGALALAASCGAPVVVDGTRTELAQVVAQPDGRLRFEAAVVPQRTRKAGRWVDVDLGLARDGEGSWRPSASVADVAFSGGGTGPLVTLRRSGRKMTMSWPGGPLPAPTVSGDSATYADVFTDVDLVVRATPTGFIHALVVKSARAAANPAVREVRFGLGGDAAVSAGPDGRLRAMVGSNVLASSESAVMWDSRVSTGGGRSAALRAGEAPSPSTAAAAGEAARVAPVAVQVAGRDLVLRPDVKLLNAPDAVFPLFIDPAWSVYKTKWAYATNNGSSNTDYSVARVGLNPDTGALYRSFFEFPTISNSVSLKGKHIESAYVQMKLDHSWSCGDTVASMYLTPAINSTMKASWSSMGLSKFLDAASGHANESGGCSSVQPDMIMNFSGSTVTGQVQTAATGNWNAITVGFTARASDGSGESTQDRWKKFLPGDAKLIVDYDTKPGAPYGLQVAKVTCPSSGVLTVGTLSPTLGAVFPDGDGADSLTASWEWIEVPSGGIGTVTDTYPTRKTPPPAKSGITPGTLMPSAAVSVVTGKTYAFRAKGTDKAPYTLTGPWSGWCQFTADTTRPPVTARMVTVPAGPGMKGRVRIESTATDVTKFRYGWDAATKEVAAQGTSPKYAEVDLTALSFGTNVLFVKAIDGTLNEGYGSVEFSVRHPSGPVAKWGLEIYPGMKEEAALADGQSAPVDTPLSPTNVAWPRDVRMIGGQTATLGGPAAPGYLSTSVPVIDTSKSYSVAAWVRLPSLPTNNMAIATQSGECDFGFFFGIVQVSGAPRWNVTMRNSDCAGAPYTVLNAPTAITGTDVNRWRHVAFSYDEAARTLTLFVDGVPISSTGWTSAWKSTSFFHVGRNFAKNTGVSDNFFNGSVADVQVFDRVLVRQDFTGQLATEPGSSGFNEPGILSPVRMGDWDFEAAVSCYVTDWKDTCEAPDSVTGWERWLALTRGSQQGAGYDSPLGLWLDNRYFPDDGFNEATQEYGRSATKLAPTTDADGNELNVWRDAPVLRTDDSFTMSAWVMRGEEGMRTALAHRGVHESAAWLKFQSDVGKWQFAVSDEDVTTTATASVRSENPAASGVWTHLAGVYDAGRKEIRLYVNGVLEGTQPVAFTPMASTGPLLVGRTLWHDQLVDQWVGGIDNVAVFQGAMTDTAVFEWYNSQTPSTPGMNTLAKDESLTAGQYLRSNVGNYQLLMQDDGNLVLSQAGFPIWDTGTWGNPGAYARLQTDGNLVVYTSDRMPLWDTRTWDTAASQLVLRDDGDLVLLDPVGTVLWRR